MRSPAWQTPAVRPPQESDLNNQPALFKLTSWSLHPSAHKVLHSVQLPRTPLCLLMESCLTHESVNKANRIINTYCCCCSSCPIPCDSMDWHTPDSPVLHYSQGLFKLMSTVWMMPSSNRLSLLSPSSPALSLSQQQGLFQWVGSSHQVAKVLGLQLLSFQWIFRVDFLYGWLVWSSYSPRDSQESSPAPQFESINSPALSFLYGPTFTFVHSYMTKRTFVSKVMCLIFNTPSWFAIAFLPRSKCLLILWLQSPSAVILEPKKCREPGFNSWSGN